MNRIPRNFFTFFLALACWTVVAQPTDCITFDEPAVGTTFNSNNTDPGAVIHEYEGGILLEMENFTDIDNQQWFDQITVIEGTLSGSTPPSLFVNYANASFVLTDSPTDVICFTSNISGHEINFGINNEIFVYESFLDPTLQEDWPNYDIVVSSTGDEPGNTVNVCVYGALDVLTIGGIELVLDDVCLQESYVCGFEDPNIESFCLSNTAASISVDFGAVIGLQDFVDIYVDNEFQGFFSTAAFPVILENIIPNGQQEASVLVCVNDDPNCCYEQVIAIENCSTSVCAFNDPALEAYCTALGTTSIAVDFSSVVGNNEFVDVYVGDELYDFFPIDGFPIILENIAATDPVQNSVIVTLCINDNPNCCYEQEVVLPVCGDEDCITFSEPEIGTVFSSETGVEPGDIIYQYPQANLSMGTFITLNGGIEFESIRVIEPWTPELESPSLYVNYATATFDFPIALQEVCFTANISGHEINLGLNGNVSLFSSLLDPALLNAFLGFDISVTPIDPSTNDLVQVCITGIIEELTLGGIEFLLDDLCAGEPICDIDNLQVGQYACDSNTDTLQFYLNFEHNQDPQDTFRLFVNNQLYGNFLYLELPITNIPVAPGAPVVQFMVEDFATDGCSDFLLTTVFGCEDACVDFGATAVELLCQEPTIPNILVSLNVPPTGQTVSLYSQSSGELIDNASYTSWAGVVFGFSVDPDPDGYILVNELTGCETFLPPFDFDPNECLECEVDITVLEPTDCNPNDVYSVVVDIETSAPWQLFNVTVDGDQVYGPFSVADFPVTVGTLIGVPGEAVLVEVNDLNGNCSAQGSVVQDCSTSCATFSSTLNWVECISANNVLVSFNLFGIEIGEPLRITDGNGNFIEERIYEGNPILVDFAPNNTNLLLIEAQEVNCFTELEYELPANCGCDLFGASLNGVECLSTNNVLLSFNLVGIAPGEPIRITDANGGFIEELVFSENPVLVDFAPSGSNLLLIEAQASNCETELQYEVPAACSCTAFNYELLDVVCLDNGNYGVTLELFGIEAGEPLRITSNAHPNLVIEQAFNENPVYLEVPPASTPVFTLFVEAQEIECSLSVDIEALPDCFPDCGEYGLTGVFCENDEVLITFVAFGPEGTQFNVEVAGQVFEFLFGQGEYEIVFSGNNAGDLPILFSQPGSNCFATFSANNPCNIPCDQRFEVLESYCIDGIVNILFAAQGEAGELFFVQFNGQIMTYEYGETTYSLTFPYDPSIDIYYLLFFDDAANCELGIDVENPCITDCDSFGAGLAYIECSPEQVWLGFEVEGIEIGEPLRITFSHLPNFVIEQTYAGGLIEVVIPSANVGLFNVLIEAQGIECEQEVTVEVTDNCIPCEERFEILQTTCSDTTVLVVFTAEGPNGEPFFVEFDDQLVEYTYGQDVYLFDLPPNPSIDFYYLVFIDEATNCTLGEDIANPCISDCDNFGAGLAYVECDDIDLFAGFEVEGIEIGEPLRITFSHLPGFVIEQDYGGGLIQLVLPNVGTPVFEVLIQAQGIDCETTLLVEVSDNCLPNCDEAFEVLETVCTDNGTPLIIFNANGPTGGPFNVRVDGVVYEFTYGEQVYELFIDDNTIPSPVFEVRYSDPISGCVREVLVENPCFCFIELGDVVATECESNGSFFVELTFSAATSWGTGAFIVSANGITQTFDEGFVSTTVGPFFDNVAEITIFEATSGLCIEEVVVEQDCGPSCEITGLVIEGTDCNPNGQYSIDVDFESNVDGPFVVTNQATGEQQTVTLADLPLTFGPYNIDEIQTSLIIVQSGTANSCAAEEVHVQECDPVGTCNFTDVFAEAYECVDGQFMVDISFNNSAGGALGFYIFGNGMIFGPYQYGETFYTFGPLDGSEEIHDILLLDIANPGCFADYTLDYSCSDECNITQVIAEVTECDGEVFGVELQVEGNNLGGQFIVVGNGNNYGTFSYDDLPIFLGPFDGDNETEYEFGVIDLLDPTCTNFVEVGPVNCQPCDIRDLEYEVDCGEAGYALTINFIYENEESDGYRLFVGNEEIGLFGYQELPFTIDLPYSIDGNSIRVEDIVNEQCGETIDFDLPCCSLGNILNEFAVTDCEDDGAYYFVVNEFNGGNLSDSLIINYAPAGSSIIATEVVAYSSLPATVGPLSGDGATAYIVVMTDQNNDCAVTTTIEPVFCDNSDCVEYEGAEGVYGPLFGHPAGTVITVENEVAISYEDGQTPGCNTCNLFVTDGIPGVDFGNGLIAVTQSTGMGLNFSNVSSAFNTVNIDFYYPGGGFGVGVNGEAAVIVDNLDDLPTSIANGVELQVTYTTVAGITTGMLTFSGENITSIYLSSEENAAFDNICLSLDDNVWPGDTNSDNVASHIDLLSIGLTYNFTGPARMDTNSEWNGFISPNWGGDFANGLNHKHADANGDGVVDAADEEVLEQNYGLTHGPTNDFEQLPYTDLDPPVFMDLEELDQLPAGTNVQIPVVAGAADQMIDDIYGMAFTLELDPERFDMSSVEVIFPTSWFGEPGTNTTHLHRVYDDGRIEVALSRTDHNNVSGFGTIMYLRIIIDDIAGVHEVPTTLVVNDIMGIDHDEQHLTLRPGMSTAMITSTKEGTDREELLSTFGIFPNPTRDVVYFKNAYNTAPNRLDLFNAAGQQLTSIKEPGMQFDLSGYPAGVYMLQIHLEGQIFTERVVKMD